MLWGTFHGACQLGSDPELPGTQRADTVAPWWSLKDIFIFIHLRKTAMFNLLNPPPCPISYYSEGSTNLPLLQSHNLSQPGFFTNSFSSPTPIATSNMAPRPLPSPPEHLSPVQLLLSSDPAPTLMQTLIPSCLAVAIGAGGGSLPTRVSPHSSPSSSHQRDFPKAQV